MFTAMQIYNNIETLRIVRGISQRQMLSDCNLSKSFMDNMKKGSMPSVDKIAAVADYFGCTIDEIVGREINNAPIEADKGELAASLRDMSKAEISRLIEFAKFLRSER